MAYTTIDEYIQTFPASEQKVLQKIRQTIKKVAPQATEKIGYGIAEFRLNGRPLIYFGGFKNHVSVYPVHEGQGPYKAEIAPYLSGKGTAKFPLDKPIPYELIAKITTYRAQLSA